MPRPASPPGTSRWRNPSRGIPSRWRRSSSKTKSSSDLPAVSTASAGSSPHSTQRPAKRPGASTRSPDLANPDGLWYVLDRTTGDFLSGKPFTKVNWMDGFDEKGRPKRVINPTTEGSLVYPNNQGATNWYPPSYSPRTGLFYIPTWADTYSTYTKGPAEYKEGNQYVGRFPTMAFPALATGPGDINQRLPEEGY